MRKINGFNKGVNFGGWLSQCSYEKLHLDTFITENDFRIAASWGVDHVRVPFDYNIIENNDGTFIDDGFIYLDMAIEAAKRNGLNIILDLHKTAGFSFDYYGENESGFFDSAEYQERFYRLWEEIARHYGSMTPNVAFELLNEVTDAEFIDAWNRIARECISRIRKIAPEILILVGSYHNNSADTVQFLDAPFDKNVIYNMHCYEPLKFTHQGAYWTTAGSFSGSVSSFFSFFPNNAIFHQSNCHDLFFFVCDHLVNIVAHLVCEILDLLLAVLEVVLCDLGILLHCLVLFHCITSDGTNCYLTLLAVFLDALAELLTAIFCELRECKADSPSFAQ